jgi:H+/Cl- antiporter ClcA
LIGWSCVVGALGGLVAAAYYQALHVSMDLVWERIAPALWNAGPSALAGHTWLVTGVGGLAVGLCVRFLGIPGEISAVVNNLHMKDGRIDVRQNRSMIPTSLVSISFGGSAGPEAPLVQIIGSFGSWIADKAGMSGRNARMLTFSGMAAALGAFFGAPLGGALFALEIPHRRGLEYYEAIVPSVTAATISYLVFSSIVGFSGPLYVFPDSTVMSLGVMLQSLALGLVGALVGALFIGVFRAIHVAAASLADVPVLRAVIGGLAIGVLADAMPDGFPVTTLFWGEFQILDIIAAGATISQDHDVSGGVVLLLMLTGLKMLAISFTLGAGFRGGFIFPLFFLGAATGLAVSLLAGGAVTMPVAMLCTMAAVNVAVTKTPLATPVILATLSGLPLLPALAAASLVSFFVTTRLGLIATQRERT